MTSTLRPLVTFRVGEHDYALELDDVIELIVQHPPTPVPGSVPRLLGVTSWRGRTLPVLGLAGALKREPAEPDGKGRFLVLSRPSPYALHVDDPGRLASPRDLVPVAIEGAEAEAEARELGLRLARWNGRLLRILDPVRILGDEPLVRTGDDAREEKA